MEKLNHVSPSRHFKSEFAKSYVNRNRLFINDLNDHNLSEMCKASLLSPHDIFTTHGRGKSPDHRDLSMNSEIITGSVSDKSTPLVRRSGFRFMDKSEINKSSVHEGSLPKCITKLQPHTYPCSLNNCYSNKNPGEPSLDSEIDVTSLKNCSITLEKDLLRIREEVEDLVKNNKDCKSKISLLLREKSKLHEELINKEDESRVLSLQLAKAQLISKTYELILSKLVSYLEEVSNFNCCCHNASCTCKVSHKVSYCKTVSSELTQKSSLLLTEIRDMSQRKKFPADVHLISRPSLERSSCETSEVWV